MPCELANTEQILLCRAPTAQLDQTTIPPFTDQIEQICGAGTGFPLLALLSSVYDQPQMCKEDDPVSQDNTKIIMIYTVAYQACRKSSCHSSTATLQCPTAQRKLQISHPDHTDEMHQHLIFLLLF